MTVSLMFRGRRMDSLIVMCMESVRCEEAELVGDEASKPYWRKRRAVNQCPGCSFGRRDAEVCITT